MDLGRAARLLAMLTLPGVGPFRLYAELKEKKSVEGAFASLGASRPGGESLLAAALPSSERAVARAAEQGLSVITCVDAGFPAVLADEHLPPPPVLFVRGRLPPQLLVPHVVELASVGVVGTRRATALGLAEARALGSALAAAGAVVVSGLALGIDGAAHRGALDSRAADPAAAPTVAVLGGAHDRLHPKGHAALAEAIVAAGGAVISEHPPGTRPQPHLFLHRNRLIAALSRALVVVEAGERSGALNTAHHAAGAGRDVLTVPARPSDRRRAGNLGLLRGGAKPLIDLSDLAVHLSSVARVADALLALAEREGRVAAGVPGLLAVAALEKLSRRRARPGVRGGADGASRAELFPAGTAGRALPAPTPAGASAAGPTIAPVEASVSETLAGADRRAHRAAPSALRVMAVLARDGEATFDGLLARLTRSGRRARPTPSELAGSLVRLEAAGCLAKGDDGRYRLRGPAAAARKAR